MDVSDDNLQLLATQYSYERRNVDISTYVKQSLADFCQNIIHAILPGQEWNTQGGGQGLGSKGRGTFLYLCTQNKISDKISTAKDTWTYKHSKK